MPKSSYQARIFGVGGLSIEDQVSQSKMPEIAESVVSQEEEEEDEFGIPLSS